MLFLLQQILLSAIEGERDFTAYTHADYVAEFQKTYGSSEEEQKRAGIFAANLALINAHNADPDKEWFAAVNQFTDMTNAEFRAKRTGIKRDRLTPDLAATVQPAAPAGGMPDKLDWREQSGVVTKPKDQGGCGSCWAFSATEALESAAALASGKAAPVLSPQQLVSCSPNPQHCGGSGGCDGSTQELAFQYTQTAGLSLEKSYKYEGVTGTCQKSKIAPVVQNKGFVKLPRNNYTALMTAVATVGPVAISLAAGSFDWQIYGGGVYSGKGCGYVEDHAVGLVGYGSAGNKNFWLVRNSWGAGWGEKGYMRLKRFGEGKEPCGTDRKPQDGGACAGDTKPITLCGACGILSDSSYPTGVSLLTEDAVEAA